MEEACVRSEQGVAITVQSIVRLVVLENAEKFVSMIKSPKGEKFLERWIKQLKADAIRHRKLKSEVGYLDHEKAEMKEELEDAA